MDYVGGGPMANSSSSKQCSDPLCRDFRSGLLTSERSVLTTKLKPARGRKRPKYATSESSLLSNWNSGKRTLNNVLQTSPKVKRYGVIWQHLNRKLRKD